MRSSVFARAVALLVLVMLGASACRGVFLPPEPQAAPAPAPEPPLQFVNQEVQKRLERRASTQEHLPLDWWRGFNDARLDSLVTTALAGNVAIAAARADLARADAEVALAASADQLTLTLRGRGDLARARAVSGAAASADIRRNAVGALEAGLLFDAFGRVSHAVAEAQARREAAEAALAGEVLRVSAAVTRSYVRLRGDQRQLALLRASLELQEKTRRIVRSRFEAGLAPELDLKRAVTTVENLRADIPSLEQTLQAGRNRLARLSGAYPGAYETALKAEAPLPTYQAPVPALVPAEMLASRPDIREAKHTLAAALAGIGLARAAYYPQLSLQGVLEITASGGVQPVGASDTLLASVQALIAQAITEGGARKARLERARAEARAALAHYRAALLAASEEVEAVLAALQTSQARQKALRRAVQASEQSVAQTQTLYQQGLISFLDVVDAQRVLANAKQALARERTRYATQLATLFEALGTSVRSAKRRDAS